MGTITVKFVLLCFTINIVWLYLVNGATLYMKQTHLWEMSATDETGHINSLSAIIIKFLKKFDQHISLKLKKNSK